MSIHLIQVENKCMCTTEEKKKDHNKSSSFTPPPHLPLDLLHFRVKVKEAPIMFASHRMYGLSNEINEPLNVCG